MMSYTTMAPILALAKSLKKTPSALLLTTQLNPNTYLLLNETSSLNRVKMKEGKYKIFPQTFHLG